MRFSDSAVSFAALACTIVASITSATVLHVHGCPLPPGIERNLTTSAIVPVFGTAASLALLLSALVLQHVWSGIPAPAFQRITLLATTLVTLYLPQWVTNCTSASTAVEFAPFAVFLLLEPVLTRNAFKTSATKVDRRPTVPTVFCLLIPGWVLVPRLFLRLWPVQASLVLAVTSMTIYHISGIAAHCWYSATFKQIAPTVALRMCYFGVGCARLLCDIVEVAHFQVGTHTSATACNASYLVLLLAIFMANLTAIVHSGVAQNEAKLEVAKVALECTSSDAAAAARSARLQAEQARRRIMRYIFHEVRGPFNSIMLGLEELTEGEAERLSPDGVVVLDMMSRSAGSAKAVLDHVLDYVHMEGGAFKSDMGPVRLGDLMHRAAAAASPLPPGMSVSVSVDPALPSTLAGDRARLQQVVATLLANACKAAPQDGTGRVHACLRVIPESLMVPVGHDEWLVRLPEDGAGSARRGPEDSGAGEMMTLAALVQSVDWKKPRPISPELTVTPPAPVVAISVQEGHGHAGASAGAAAASRKGKLGLEGRAQTPHTTVSSASMDSIVSPTVVEANACGMATTTSTTTVRPPTGGGLGAAGLSGRSLGTVSRSSSSTAVSPMALPALTLQLTPLTDSAPTKESARLSVPILYTVPMGRETLSQLDGRGYAPVANMQAAGADATATAPYITVLLYISHNGPCVPSQDRERLFHAFSMAEAGGHFTSQATGLGLAVAAEIVRLHGGVVGVGVSSDAPVVPTLAVMLRLPVLAPRPGTGGAVGTTSAVPTGASATSSPGRGRLKAWSSAESGAD